MTGMAANVENVNKYDIFGLRILRNVPYVGRIILVQLAEKQFLHGKMSHIVIHVINLFVRTVGMVVYASLAIQPETNSMIGMDAYAQNVEKSEMNNMIGKMDGVQNVIKTKMESINILVLIVSSYFILMRWSSLTGQIFIQS